MLSILGQTPVALVLAWGRRSHKLHTDQALFLGGNKGHVDFVCADSVHVAPQTLELVNEKKKIEDNDKI